MERLQKVLARAGVASRRASEELILAGRVQVNGRVVTELGTKVDAHKDRVEVDGRRLVAEKPVYYLVHKPREMVTTLDDPEGRPPTLDRELEESSGFAIDNRHARFILSNGSHSGEPEVEVEQGPWSKPLVRY